MVLGRRTDRPPGSRSCPRPGTISGRDRPRAVVARPAASAGSPVLRNDWVDLSFLHWAYDPEVVQRLLPTGLTVDVHDGRAWVALVPFTMDASPVGIPSVPWLHRFAETNVRTYVVDDQGRRAVWGLPEPEGEPLVHHVTKVVARFGRADVRQARRLSPPAG